MTEKITYLDPNEIQTDDRLQVRSVAIFGDKSRGDEAGRLKEMRKRIYAIVSEGQHVEPIEVIKCDGEWLVFDGHNRLSVYQKVAEKKPVKIPAVVLLHVPAHSDHPFRFNPITDFGLIRSPISELSDQK